MGLAVSKTLFITRHAGAVKWAQRQGIDAEMHSHLDPATVGHGDVVIGTLPVSLVAELNARGARYMHLVLDLPPDMRGRELSADEMTACGARLEEYRVERVGEILK